ncbi:Neuropeptide FF receptor 2 [Sarcoptes scabiei]|uniref:Neuropeptide FF receptor 2 n=1 Tax=Sarcoptes scabiei TaxID=52283 RepID=A0A834RHD8_SARSC|nr:Neuropeptide FF receptor 2 [Sarcoptes scabiei]
MSNIVPSDRLSSLLYKTIVFDGFKSPSPSPSLWLVIGLRSKFIIFLLFSLVSANESIVKQSDIRLLDDRKNFSIISYGSNDQIHSSSHSSQASYEFDTKSELIDSIELKTTKISPKIESNRNISIFQHQTTGSSSSLLAYYNLRHSFLWTIILILAYLIVFFFGLFGNISVLWIVFMLKRERKYRKSGHHLSNHHHHHYYNNQHHQMLINHTGGNAIHHHHHHHHHPNIHTQSFSSNSNNNSSSYTMNQNGLNTNHSNSVQNNYDLSNSISSTSSSLINHRSLSNSNHNFQQKYYHQIKNSNHSNQWSISSSSQQASPQHLKLTYSNGSSGGVANSGCSFRNCSNQNHSNGSTNSISYSSTPAPVASSVTINATNSSPPQPPPPPLPPATTTTTTTTPTTSVPSITINRYNQVFYHLVCNLALADLLVVQFCLIPTLIGNIYLPWVLGRSVCKAVPYLQGVSVNASVYTLVAISIDRFYAIYYPLNKKCSTAICWITIAMIWLFSLLISFPWLVYFDVITVNLSDYSAGGGMMSNTDPDDNDNDDDGGGGGSGGSGGDRNTFVTQQHIPPTTIQICGDTWPSVEMANAHFLIVNLGLQYLIPLSIIALFYILILKKIAERKLPKLARHLPANVKDGNRQSSLVIERSKVKVFKMLIVLVLLFALSWLPLYVIFFMLKIGPHLDEQSFSMQMLQDSVPIAQWLGASNSCVNPILYFFFNAKFRSYYRTTWLKTFNCLSVIRYRSHYRHHHHHHHHHHQQQHSRSNPQQYRIRNENNNNSRQPQPQPQPQQQQQQQQSIKPHHQNHQICSDHNHLKHQQQQQQQQQEQQQDHPNNLDSDNQMIKCSLRLIKTNTENSSKDDMNNINQESNDSGTNLNEQQQQQQQQQQDQSLSNVYQDDCVIQSYNFVRDNQYVNKTISNADDENLTNRSNVTLSKPSSSSSLEQSKTIANDLSTKDVIDSATNVAMLRNSCNVTAV